MSWRTIEEIHTNRSSNLMKSFMVFICMSIIISLSFYGCGDKPASPPEKAPKTKAVKNKGGQAVVPQPDSVISELPEQEGYIYQQRDRRDPFVPLIVPKKKAVKIEGIRPGTLESYDIGDFTLSAIAQKGGKYFALLTTPDNRSFTVNKGTAIGLYKGRVEEITKDRIVIIEYSSDFRGESKPRQLILEFRKGEVQ